MRFACRFLTFYGNHDTQPGEGDIEGRVERVSSKIALHSNLQNQINYTQSEDAVSSDFVGSRRPESSIQMRPL